MIDAINSVHGASSQIPSKRLREEHEESPSKRQCTREELPRELYQKIFTYLGEVDLARASGVNKEWLENVEALPYGIEKRLGVVSKYKLGKAVWAHLGDVGEEPPLPEGLYEMLAEPCPAELGLERFGTTIKETHILVLIPKTLDNQLLTLGRFKQFLDQRDGPKITTWSPGGVKNTLPNPSYWALISKACIKDSKNKNYNQQKQMVAQPGANYRLPKVIEMVCGLYLQEKVHGSNLYDKNSWTRCEERHSHGYPLAVRGFGSGGGVCHIHGVIAYDFVGVGVSWNFSF